MKTQPRTVIPQTLDRDYMTIAQTADYLQCSTSTVREHIRTGRLPASQLVKRGAIRIPAAAIEKLLAKSRA
jgi:excisionase family DNA binding protein